MFHMGRSMVLFSMRHKRQAFSYRGARDVMTGVTVREPPHPPPPNVAKRKEEGDRFKCVEKPVVFPRT